MKSTLLAAALVAACCAAQAQVTPPEVAAHQKQELKKGDPARWYKADRGSAAQQQTLKKEIKAALAEARAECRQMQRSEQGGCMQEALATYQSDMNNVRQQVADANNMQRYETSGR